jgi:hypothetical protein
MNQAVVSLNAEAHVQTDNLYNQTDGPDLQSKTKENVSYTKQIRHKRQ